MTTMTDYDAYTHEQLASEATALRAEALAGVSEDRSAEIVAALQAIDAQQRRFAYAAEVNTWFGNEGYDLICIHPDPRRQNDRVVRVQVKSRY